MLVSRETDADQCSSIISLEDELGYREMKHTILLHVFIYTLQWKLHEMIYFFTEVGKINVLTCF